MREDKAAIVKKLEETINLTREAKVNCSMKRIMC